MATTQKVKIHSPRAELTVLRGLLHKDKKIAGTLLSLVDGTYFYDMESQEVYEAIRKHMREEGESPSFKILLQDPSLSDDARAHLKASEPTIETVRDAKNAAKALNTYRKRRGMHNIALNIARKFENTARVDVDALLEETSSALLAIRSRKTGASLMHLGKNSNTSEDVHRLLYDDRSDDLIPTGIKAFDDVAGGFARGALVTIGSTSGGGKSTTTMAMGMKQARMGYKVLMVPLEMSKDEMLMRCMANTSKMDLTKIITQKMSADEKALVKKRHATWERRVAEAGGSFNIYKPDEDMTIEEITAATATFEYDVLIIDYATLLKGADGDDQWRALGQIARYCKIFAEATKKVVVLIVQINEDGKIRYSRAMSEHSNNCWVWIATKEAKESGIMNVEQPKSRNSESYPFKIKIIYKWMRVEDVDDSEFGPKSEDTEVEDEGKTTVSKKGGKTVKVTSKLSGKKKEVVNLAADI